MQQGLLHNKNQFALLVLVNAFVGAMIGLERAVLPNFGATVFSLDGNFIILSFIVAFGLSKAISNYWVAYLSKTVTRKNILLLGWLVAIPVPFMLMYAPNWNWIIAANILLGINQGLAWSTTVIMKIDLVGEKDRGFAMGINEFAGYLSVGVAAWLASVIASKYGYAFFPFIPGIVFVFLGLIITIFWVKDTAIFIQHESKTSTAPLLNNVWKETSLKHRNISTISLNGMMNNLNDAVAWGVIPLLLVANDFTIAQIGLVAAIYPITWGVSQIFTGKLGDVFCKKQLIVAGMLLQSVALLIFVVFTSYVALLIASFLLGLGTALVYPNFLSVVAENTHPTQRAKTLSIFRFWRDMGYVIGALISGVLINYVGMQNAILIAAALTAFAAIVAHYRMCCTKQLLWKSEVCLQYFIPTS
jgi:MFS family permease